MYPIELIRPMAQELENSGFESLSSQEQVKSVLTQAQGTVLLVVNSVCGCAAANARPGVRMALNQDQAEQIGYGFAGVDRKLLPLQENFCCLIHLHLQQ